MGKKYIVALLILILIFSCGKKDKKSENPKSQTTVEQGKKDRIKELTEGYTTWKKKGITTIEEIPEMSAQNLDNLLNSLEDLKSNLGDLI